MISTQPTFPNDGTEQGDKGTGNETMRFSGHDGHRRPALRFLGSYLVIVDRFMLKWFVDTNDGCCF